MFSSTWVRRSLLNIEGSYIFKKRFFKAAGKNMQRLSSLFRISNGLVINIGDVHNLLNTKSPVLKVTPKKVSKYISAVVPNMRISINSGSTIVHQNSLIR